jgi:recombination protein RecA
LILFARSAISAVKRSSGSLSGTFVRKLLKFAFYSLSERDILQPVQPILAGRGARRTREDFMADERTRAIDLAFAQIEKQFGKGSIMRLGSKEAIVPISVISTGAISFDAALGVGGVPRGRVVEIFGPESSGKTTIALQVIAEAQRQGGMAAFVDAEHALDPIYAKKLGVDVDNLLVSQPDYGEQALEITEQLVRSGAIDVLVVDSVAALVPKAELDGEMGDSHMGLQARLMSQALRKLTGTVSKSRTCLIFINQIREKIGVMFGNPETTTGGRALKFYASVRIDIRRIAAIKEGDVVTGSRTKVKVVKNKVAAPFRDAEFDILYGEGISREGDLLDLAVNQSILEKSGSWFSYKGERIGQGRENARQFLKDNKDITARLEAEVRKALGLIQAQPAAQAQGAAQGAGQSAKVTAMPTGTEGKPAPRR